MHKNVGGTERTARLAIGALLAIVGIAGYAGFVALAFLGIGQALASLLALLVGAILLVTGFVGWCPITYALGIDTYSTSGDEDESPVEKSA